MPTSSSTQNPTVIDRVPFGVPAFDRVLGGVPNRCVSLVFGQSQVARWATCFAFANALVNNRVPPAVISVTDPAQWVETSEAFGGQVKPPDVEFLHVAQNVLTPQLAHDAWLEMLPTLEGRRNGRIAFCSALPWLAFVPERNMREYVAAFVGALEELSANVLLVLPEPVSPRATTLVRHLEAACPVVIRLDPGNEANSIHWTTRRFDGSFDLPEFDLAESDLRELPQQSWDPVKPGKKSATTQDKSPITLDYARLMGMESETKTHSVTANERYPRS